MRLHGSQPQLTKPTPPETMVELRAYVGLWRSLGARFHGMEEVVGSIPTRSTNIPFKISKLGTYTPTGYQSNLLSFGVKSSDLFFDSILIAHERTLFPTF
jgi:hypothetical protein